MTVVNTNVSASVAQANIAKNQRAIASRQGALACK